MDTTVDEILGLPYGESSTAVPEDAETVNSLEYPGQSAFAEGLTAGDFRREYRRHGQRIRWWKALRDVPTGFTGPNGETRVSGNGPVYLEQPLESGVRVLFWQSQEIKITAEFGVIDSGTTMIGCLPDEMELAPFDRILALDQRLPPERVVQQGEAPLPASYPAAVLNVWTFGELIDPSTYGLEGREIIWHGEVPEGDLVIEFQRHPLYEFRGELNHLQPIDSDGVRLPQRGALRLVSKGAEHG